MQIEELEEGHCICSDRNGLLDLTAYDAFLSGKLIDWEPSEIHVPQFVKDQV